MKGFQMNNPYGQNLYPQTPSPPTKWYRTTGGTIVLLFFFFPIGLYLMWRYMKWPKNTKWIVTGVIIVFGIIGSINNAIAENNRASQQPPIVVTRVVYVTPAPTISPI